MKREPHRHSEEPLGSALSVRDGDCCRLVTFGPSAATGAASFIPSACLRWPKNSCSERSSVERPCVCWCSHRASSACTPASEALASTRSSSSVASSDTRRAKACRSVAIQNRDAGSAFLQLPPRNLGGLTSHPPTNHDEVPFSAPVCEMQAGAVARTQHESWSNRRQMKYCSTVGIQINALCGAVSKH